MIRRAAICFLATALAAPAFAYGEVPPEKTAASVSDTIYSSGRWIADLHQIETLLAEQEPNIEWSIAERGLDLPQLARDAESELRAAASDADARDILRDFLSKFGDGHISIVWPDEKPDDGMAWGTASICKGLGYEQEERPPGLPFDRLGAHVVTTPDSETFPISVIDLPGGKLGVLRIPSFYEWGYFDYCPEAVAEIGLPEDGECNSECGGAIGQKAAELLTKAVGRQIAKLKQEGVSALAVDITQNGGGSLWLDPVARMLTAVKLKAPRLAFTRTQGWRDTIAANIAAVEADLANPVVGLSYRQVLTKARDTLQRALAEASKSCDRSGIWTGETPACSLTVPDLLYATGILDYAPPGEYSLLGAASSLFYSSLYPYEEGLWSGPLYVLLDEGSASAAEHFATLLRDNQAATLIGEPSYGAGCGWMGQGDQPATLNETRAELHVPDCVWTNAKGENEVAGIEPDILVPWRYYDNPFQKARRALAVLKTLDTSSWNSPTLSGPPASGTGRAGQN